MPPTPPGDAWGGGGLRASPGVARTRALLGALVTSHALLRETASGGVCVRLASPARPRMPPQTGRLCGLQPCLQRLRRHVRLRRVHAVPFVSPLAAVLGAPLHAGGKGQGPVSCTQGHPRRRCHAARASASYPLPVALHPPTRQGLKGPQGLLPWSCRGEVIQ